MITGKTAGIIFAAIAGLVSSACDNRPPDEKLRAKLPEIKDAMFDDREDRELAKALAPTAGRFEISRRVPTGPGFRGL